MTRLYRLKEIIGDKKQKIKGIFPVSRASWYQGIKDGRYPAGIKLSERSIAWRSEDIEKLIAGLAAASVED